MSRPYYKTYYDYNEDFFKDRSYYLMVLLALYFAHYAYYRYEIEAARWHVHERRHGTERPAHHFNNRGGVVLEKEFVGFNKYFTDEQN